MEFWNRIRQFNFKRYRRVIVIVLMLLAVLIIAGIHKSLVGQLDTQRMAERWSTEEEYSQISCFFPKGEGMTESELFSLEQSIMNALSDAAVDTSEGSGRKFVDAYSTEGSLFLASDRASTEARVYGVSKDFFLFHPLELLAGSYFTQSDSAEDGIILDETVAWKLFGSSNVAGLTVDIGNRTYVVRGVVRSDSGFFSRAANEEEATVYVDYGVLEEQMGQELSIDNYEVLIPNPVNEFGTTTLKDTIAREEDSYEMVENSARFSFISRLERLKNFGVRSMNTMGIRYPYWENRARGYEDISSLLLAVQLLLLVYPVIFLCRVIRLFWKKKAVIWKKIKDVCATGLKKLYKDTNIYGKMRKYFVK